MSTAVEQSLQIALQEPAAAIAVAVLLGGGLVGMSIRTIVESVVIDDENDGSDDSESGVEETPTGNRETAPDVTAASGRDETESESEPDPEELESRLDHLENEVGSLSSTVDSVRAENEQISESVDEVEANTGRLVSLFRRAMGGSSGASASDPAQSERQVDDQGESEPTAHGSAQTEPKSHESQQERETEVVSESLLGGGDEETPGVREKHCVDSDEEIIDTSGQSTPEKGSDDNGVTEEVEEIGSGTFEGTRFSSPDTTTETFGIEETITTVASDGGTAIRSEGESTTEFAPEGGTAEPESPSVEEPDSVEIDAETVEPDTETVEPENPEPETEPVEPEPETGESATDRAEPELELSEPETADIPDQITPATGPTPETEQGGKPYLESLPEGFGAEVLTVEWMEFLVEEVGIKEAARALDYYETIGWLTEDAAAELEAYLDGLEPGDRANLSVEHHLKTLEYVEELTVSEQTDGSEDIK